MLHVSKDEQAAVRQFSSVQVLILISAHGALTAACMWQPTTPVPRGRDDGLRGCCECQRETEAYCSCRTKSTIAVITVFLLLLEREKRKKISRGLLSVRRFTKARSEATFFLFRKACYSRRYCTVERW